jgi:hypothetical protein
VQFEQKLTSLADLAPLHNDDPDLPSDLAALAEQLRDDATHLAASHPPVPRAADVTAPVDCEKQP